jgi:hypothetical protein
MRLTRRTTTLLAAAVLGGSALTMAAAPAMAGCSSGYLCLWTGTNERGTQVNIPAFAYSQGKNYSLLTWFPDAAYVGSVWNNWSHRVWLNQKANSNEGGYSLCYPAVVGKGNPELLAGSQLNFVIFGVPTNC